MRDLPSFGLSLFELPPALALPMIRMLRIGNTVLDTLFYDVGEVGRALRSHGVIVDIDPADDPEAKTLPWRKTTLRATIELDALSNPEGSILVVDVAAAPEITRYKDVLAFLASEDAKKIKTISVTGVGSSALGSAAFAWNISAALGEKVAAIVPGLGVADVVQQALGGWFGFGMRNWWVKQMTQEVLAETQPALASIGRGLLASVPDHRKASTGAPVFRNGSGSCDVLHELLKTLPNVIRVIGHSKGALVIENAIASLDGAADRLHVVTLGCPVGEETRTASFEQVLGWFDPLGLLNAWGNMPDRRVFAHHSTNSWIPLSMDVSKEVTG